MSEVQHSNVLFINCDDGLPLEFNVRNTNEKNTLKAMIEQGGGVCSQDENAVHLISPGTKVLNADLGKKLVSSRYIFDCVKQNCLLDVNDYVFTISEAHTSDISDEDSDKLLPQKTLESVLDENQKESIETTNEPNVDLNKTDNSIFLNVSNSTPSNNVNTHRESNTSSTQSESFIEGSPDIIHRSKQVHTIDTDTREFVPLTSTAKEPNSKEVMNQFSGLSPIKESQLLVTPKQFPQNVSNNSDQNFEFNPVIRKGDVFEDPFREVSINQAVSSSQPVAGELDQFDVMILNKSQKKADADDEESLSQSYTVSSSADAQVASKPNSDEANSAEIFAIPSGSAVSPDSPIQSQSLDRQSYLRNLEAQVEKILQKPSPKSIQDKILLVKYICCVKRLSPATVLQSLQQL